MVDTITDEGNNTNIFELDPLVFAAPPAPTDTVNV
jgi:hypothetical protein